MWLPFLYRCHGHGGPFAVATRTKLQLLVNNGLAGQLDAVALVAMCGHGLQ